MTEEVRVVSCFLATRADEVAALDHRRYLGRSLFGRAFHVLPVEKPQGAGPFDPFWDRRAITTLCGRVIEAHPVGDTFADGTPVPVCRACARVGVGR